jgi:hypothetical protein
MKSPPHQNRRCALELGAVDFIVKPFSTAEFVSRNSSDAKPKPRSNFPNENPNPNPQSLCDPPQGNQRNVLFAPFDPADIIGVKVGLFRQTLLAQMQPFPLFADGGTENNAIVRRRHSQKQKQRLPRISTPLNG